MTIASSAAPGVYAVGGEATTLPVAATAIAGFVGIAERGPVAVPQPLRSWGDYLDVFGGFVPYGHLAETVHAFFLNGGERCWVVRTADTGVAPEVNPTGACRRWDVLAPARTIQPIVDRNNAPTLSLEAINPGSWGNQLEFRIDPESPQDFALTTLRSPAAPSDTLLRVESVVDLEPNAPIRLTATGTPFAVGRYQVAAVNPALNEITVAGQVGAHFPRGATLSGRGFRLQFRHGDTVEVFDRLSMNPDHPRYFVAVIGGDPAVTSYLERREQGASILARVVHLRGPGGALRFKPRATVSPQRLAGGGDGFRYAAATFPAAGGGSMRLSAKRDRGTAGNELHVTLEPFQTRTALPVPLVPGGPRDDVVVEEARGFVTGDVLSLSFTAPNGTLSTEVRTVATADPASNRLRVTSPFGSDFPVASKAFVQNRFDLVVHRGTEAEPLERLRNLDGAKLAGPAGTTRWFRAIVNDPNPQVGSQYLCADLPGMNLTGLAGTAALAGGLDPGTIDYRFYTGYNADGSHFAAAGTSAPVGLAAFETIEEVTLVAIPDLHRLAPRAVENDFPRDFERAFAQGQRDLLHHCEQVGGRFALLDPPPEVDAATIERWPQHFADTRLARNGALYFPWVTGVFGDARPQVPPCGFVAGQIAATDRQAGVGKAPANGTFKGIAALAAQADREWQARLNPAGVNCLRKFEDGAVRLFGARTLSHDPRFQYVNVRRALLAVVQALTRRMLWAVFEPNDDQLRLRIESAVTGYLSTLVARGVTASSDSSASFYVKCNVETNPPEVRDAGRVIAEIGLALAAPAEFIVLTARRSPESLTIVEEDT